jgi:AcrR family transcriptional regulator
MKDLIAQMQIRVNDKIYLKDPNTSELGKNIVKESIVLIEDLGLENFTFKKLATHLETTESSIYRYFENKHKLLMYLTSWYWAWMEYKMVFATANIESADNRLKAAIQALSSSVTPKDMSAFEIDLSKLYHIVIAESSKAYLIKEVDNANKDGFYESYKRLIRRLSTLAVEINPKIANPNSLMSTVIEGIYHQKFMSRHFSSVSDLKDDTESLGNFFTELALAYIRK